MMDIKNILKDFSRLAEARKNHTFRTRLVFIFCAATIAMVLFFSYRVVNSAMDKILVVNEGGELLRFKAMQQDLLYESLLKNHCYHTAYYLNSFDRLSLQENRARALFLGFDDQCRSTEGPNLLRHTGGRVLWSGGIVCRPLPLGVFSVPAFHALAHRLSLPHMFQQR